jgi:hypothetical protein
MELEAVMVVPKKINDFWDVIPCIVVDIDQHFCRTYLSYGVFYRKY